MNADTIEALLVFAKAREAAYRSELASLQPARDALLAAARKEPTHVREALGYLARPSERIGWLEDWKRHDNGHGVVRWTRAFGNGWWRSSAEVERSAAGFRYTVVLPTESWAVGTWQDAAEARAACEKRLKKTWDDPWRGA